MRGAVAADVAGGSAGYTVLRGLLSDTALHTFRQEEAKLRHLLAPDSSTLEELGYWGTLSRGVLLAGCGYWGTPQHPVGTAWTGYWATQACAWTGYGRCFVHGRS